jgi:hypothetical protein
MQDLVCLYTDGHERWRQERVWEYERGFIGPGVFAPLLAFETEFARMK